jgi:prepilin peptidase CpaA
MIVWIYCLILIELVIVSWIDLKIKKISNIWLMINLAFAIIFHFLYPDFYHFEWASLAFPVGWIVVGFVLFVLKIMGAGDSKFLASLFLLLPLKQHAIMFEKVLYSTLVVGLVMLAFKIGRDFKKIKAYALSTYWHGFKESIRSNFSFAPVILLAWILLGVEQWK